MEFTSNDIIDINVSNIICLEGLFRGANDVFVIMSVGEGSSWQHQTAVRREAGDHAAWTDAFSARVTIDEVREGKVILDVKDHNKDHHTPIGKATINVVPMFSRVNKWVDFDGDLKHQRKVSGKYLMRMRYRDRPERPDKQCLHVSKISLSHIFYHGKLAPASHWYYYLIVLVDV